MSIRVYLPVTAAALAELVAQGRLTGPLDGHAVTDALQVEWPDGDIEQWEYAALAAAADVAWQTRGPDQQRRRVIAADVASVEPREDEVTGIRIVGDLLWKHVAAAHVDTADLVAGPDADGGPDLAWFATQEIADLTAPHHRGHLRPTSRSETIAAWTQSPFLRLPSTSRT